MKHKKKCLEVFSIGKVQDKELTNKLLRQLYVYFEKNENIQTVQMDWSERKKKKKFYEIDPSRTEGEEGKQYRPQVQVNNNESLIKSVLIDYE